MGELQFKNSVGRFLPEDALHYCYTLWYEHNFTFKIKNKRASKLGDYRYDPRSDKHVITVNNDLNPYAFLITYIHEVAHLVTYKKHKRQVKPHGKEWKDNFKYLMLPVLNNKVFPDDVLRTLASYLKNPKASSCSDHKLVYALNRHDKDRGVITLKEVSRGQLFKFRERVFRKEELKRTRYVCLDMKNKRRYLISQIAEVELLKESA